MDVVLSLGLRSEVDCHNVGVSVWEIPWPAHIGLEIEWVVSNQATFTVALHPTVAMLSIPATVSASGTVSGSVTLGGQTTGVPVKFNTATKPATIAPTGTLGKIQVIQYHLGVSHDAEMWLTLLTAVSTQLPTAWQTTVASLIVDLTNLGL